LKNTLVDISVDCSEGVLIDSFPGELAQVLTNLIINATVHAFDDNQPGHINIKVLPMGENLLEIVFSDNGKGIPKELHAQVFEPFFTTRRSAGGSGLGLHIVHNIVTQSLKGTLIMDSDVGQGTTFSIRLPKKLSSSPSEPEL